MYDGCPYKILVFVSVSVIAEVLARPLTLHDFTKLNKILCMGFFYLTLCTVQTCEHRKLKCA